MAMIMAILTMTSTVTMMAMIDYRLPLESNGMIAAITYFLYSMRMQGRISWQQGNGRREEKSGLIFCNVYGDGDGNGNDSNSND